MPKHHLLVATTLVASSALLADSATLTILSATYPAPGCSAPVVFRQAPARSLDQSYWADVAVSITNDGHVLIQSGPSLSRNVPATDWSGDYVSNAFDAIQHSIFTPAICSGQPTQVSAIVRFGSEVDPGKSSTPIIVLHKEQPDYSNEAARANFRGTIRTSITVNARGNLDSITVLDSPRFGLETEIIRALTRWRFKPATRDGQPVSATEIVTTTFDRR
jgi:TonB family protein